MHFFEHNFQRFFPVGWIAAQIATGIIIAAAIKISKKYGMKQQVVIACTFSVIGLAVGIIGCKTLIECAIFKIPFEVKIVKNFIAFSSDIVPLIIGIILGFRLKRRQWRLL